MTTIARQAAVSIGLKPRSNRSARTEDRRNAGEMRRAAVTLLLALYPLVGSVTVVLAALMLAGGAHAG